jgi:hypothetical protein
MRQDPTLRYVQWTKFAQISKIKMNNFARKSRVIIFLASAGLVFSPSASRSIMVIPCSPSTPNIVCGVIGTGTGSNSFGYSLKSGTPASAYGDPPAFLVTTETKATSIMAASAEALNAFAATIPFDPNTPPVLFGDLGLDEFKIAYEVVLTPGGRIWNSSLSRWEDTGGKWEIVPRIVQIPDGEVNVWTVPLPGPLPLLGVGTAFGYSRILRKRIKDSTMTEVSTNIR